MGGNSNGREVGQELVNCLTGPRRPADPRDDGAELVAYAQRHRMLPALRARQAVVPILTRPTASRLETLVRLDQMMNRQSRAQLVEILTALGAAGIDVIVLKGLANTVLAPGQPRASADHDLLVRPDAADRAGEVMAALGYQQRATELGTVESYRTGHHHDAPWSRADHRQPVEIHRHPLAISIQAALDVDGLWQRSVPLTIDGVTVRRLGDVDQVLHLAVHSTEDGPARRLRELWELAGWTSRLDGAGWNQVVQLAGTGLLARRVWAGLAATRAVLGTDVDHGALTDLAAAGGLSARRRRRWCTLAVQVVLDEIPARWEGWPARASIEAASGAGAVTATVAAAWSCARTSAGRGDGPRGPWRRGVRTLAGLAGPIVGRRAGAGGRRLRRGADVVGSLLLGVVALPVIAGLALVAAVRSPGPLLYRQLRVGRHGEPFELLKLRSMPADAEAISGPMLSPRRDPRVIPGFAMVRRLHLDELPQLWNVLRGEMSLVGPRPERPEFTRILQRSIPGYAERHRLAPGLTGLAQITLGYHAAPAGKLARDLDWVRRPGLLRYLRILFTTPWSIARGPADRDTDPAFDEPFVIDLTETDEVASSVA